MVLAATLASTILLCIVHLSVGRMRILDRGRGNWKSVAGGVGVTYTFLVLLPKVAKAQPVLEAATQVGVYGFLVHHSYLAALSGLVIYYGMDSAVENVLMLRDRSQWRPMVRLLVYIHASSLAGYYFLISYLMTMEIAAGYVGYISLALFVLAMLFHYATIDHGLRTKYGGIYDPFLRWAFVAATTGGWIVALTTEIPYTSLALLNCLFAGALIVFTLKEKTPGSDHVRFLPFLVGVSLYAMLLLIIEWVD